MRIFEISRVEFAGFSWLMQSFRTPWGRDDPILEQIHKAEFDETGSLSLWAYAVSSAPTGSHCIDVGAFSGLFALTAVAMRSDIRCVPFEPAAMTFGRLAQNAFLNSVELRILPANLAVSDSERPLTLPHAFGIYSMSPGEQINGQRYDHTQPATAIMLDTLLEPAERLPHYLNSKGIPLGAVNSVCAVKVDVEGHEHAVLKGATNLIRKQRPVLICEAWDLQAEATITEILKIEQYKVKRIGQERNLLCIPEERVEEWVAGFSRWHEEKGDLAILAKSHLSFNAT